MQCIKKILFLEDFFYFCDYIVFVCFLFYGGSYAEYGLVSEFN